ncbi:MAG: ABC transporter permease, partial [Gemmatimonadota bacterium]
MRRDHGAWEVNAEIRFHLEMRTAKLMAEGWKREAAELEAQRRFGEVEGIKRECRNIRRRGDMRERTREMIESVLQNIRYGLRTLARSPGFTVIAVLILGLGIGANSTMFTLVNGLFLETPPLIDGPEELVGLTMIDDGDATSDFAYPDFEFYRDNNDVFSGVMAYDHSVSTVAVGGRDEVVQAEAWAVSGNFFDVLVVPMAHGRSFLPEQDEVPGEHPVVVISNGFWRRYYGADPSAVNSTLLLNGHPCTVVGVTSRGFRGVSAVDPAPDLYLPIMMLGTVSPTDVGWFEHRNRGLNTWLRIVARLRPGVNRSAAQAHMDVLQSRWESHYASWIGATFEDEEPYHVGLYQRFHLTPRDSDRLSQLLVPLFLAVGSVLLIACANIAILLLARASARQREMGIRTALGAGRVRVMGQLMTESVLLASIGGALGIAIAYWGAGLAAGMIPMSFAAEFDPDGTTIGFTVLLSAGAALLFGMAPAWQLSRTDISAFLHRQGQGRNRNVLQNGLVVAQVALSIVLVTGAGLFVRSLQNAQSVDLGFNPARKLLMSVVLDNHGYSEAEGHEFVRVMLERLKQVPGVSSASTTMRTP